MGDGRAEGFAALYAQGQKAAKRSGGEMLLNAVTVPSLYYPGSEPVPVDKTNEIPVARALFERLDLEGRLVGLDALHTQAETARALVQEAGADYMLTLKDNQKGIRRTVRTLFAATEAAFSPSEDHVHSEMGAEHASYAMRFITTRYPTFRKRS